MTKQTKANTGPLAVSIQRAAELSGVGRSTIYAAIKRGELKTLKIGSRRLVLVAELAAWLDAHRQG